MLKKAFEHIGNCIYGFFSGWYVLYCYVFIRLPLMERGSYEWEEDKGFIPFAVFFFFVWLCIFGYILSCHQREALMTYARISALHILSYKIKKKKTVLFLTEFLVFAALGIFTAIMLAKYANK